MSLFFYLCSNKKSPAILHYGKTTGDFYKIAKCLVSRSPSPLGEGWGEVV